MVWFWHSHDDRSRCEGFANGDPRLAQALALAADHHGDTPRSAIPWLSWSLQLCVEFGAPSLPEPLAIAVALLRAPRQERTSRQFELAIKCLDTVALNRRDVAGVLLASQLLSPPALVAPGAEQLEPEGTPTEHAMLWGLAALAAKLDPEPWVHFAATLAEPVGLYQSLLDIVDDTPREPGGPPARLGALLRAFANDRALLEPLLAACAGAPDDPRRLSECRIALANPMAFKALVLRREKWLANAWTSLPTVNAAPGKVFLSALTDGLASLERVLWLRLVMTHARDIAVPQAADLRISVRAAVDYLDDTRPWCSAWDVHRFHPMGAPGVLINRLFIQGMILLALGLVDGNRHTELAALLDQVPDGDLRYFPDWRGLPPDSDSLGLMLQLAVQLPQPPRWRLDGWITLLEHNIGDDKLLPVWLPRGPLGPTATLPGPFLGNECTATRIAVLLALMCYDAERFMPLVQPNLKAVLSRHGAGGFADCVHYGSDFAEHLFLRLTAELATRVPIAVRKIALDLGVEDVAGTICNRLLAEQRIDGSWGSPQRTALALEGLADMGAAAAVLARAAKNLVETQRPDGAWSAEPLYITPRKSGGMTPFAAKELTTAICVRALQKARGRL